jgi:hypothetical protein
MNDDHSMNCSIKRFETALGGVQVYETALRCVKNAQHREEWEMYHE